MCLLHNLFSGMAEEHLLDTGPAAGSDYDQTDVLLLGELDDLIKGYTMENIGVAVHLRWYHGGDHFLQSLSGILLKLHIELRQDTRAQVVLGEFGEILQHMEKKEPCLEEGVEFDGKRKGVP